MPDIEIAHPKENKTITDHRILIVEDDVDMRNLIRHYLKKINIHQCIEAVDGQSALTVLQSEKVDLIISDLYMPNMTGLELYTQIKENKDLNQIPFLMISAESSKTKITEAMMLGVRNYIIKPIDAENMIAKIKRLLKIN